MEIADLMRDVHETAKEKGWHDHPRTIGDFIALCHSELSEALEEYRHRDLHSISLFGEKPEGFIFEIADTIIRLLDMCAFLNLDVEEALRLKTEYNKTRPYRHGGKRL